MTCSQTSSAPKGSARAAIGARCALLAAIYLAILAGCAITWRPPLLPIEITVTSCGEIIVAASPELVTPLGTFSVSVQLGSFDIPPNQTLLAILHLVHICPSAAHHGPQGGRYALARYDTGGRTAPGGTEVMSVYKINSDVKMRFLLDGPYRFTPEGTNIAQLTPGKGVSAISVENLDDQKAAPRLSAMQVSYPTPLPTPTQPGLVTLSPPPASSPAPVPQATPTNPAPAKTPTAATAASGPGGGG